MCETVIKRIAQHIKARNNCITSGNKEIAEEHADKIEEYIKEYLPSGSGINNGTTINLSMSTDTHIEFFCEYHHIGNGRYTRTTGHRIIVTASLANDFDLHITGEDYHQIKDYLYDTYRQALEFNIETQS